MITVSDLENELRQQGFEPGTPQCLRRLARDIDARVCENAECDLCGRQGLVYRPFHRGDSYRALAVCPDCGHAVEF
jgi:hypothetical protein